MIKPRFSVVIPTLNEEKFVSKLLLSLTRQTVKNFDVVVVDGQSKDGTIAVVNKFARKLPLAVIAGKKTGVSFQRNLGAKNGKADWLVFVDADSVLLPNFMERIGHFIDKKHSKFFTTWLKADTDDPKDSMVALFINMTVEGAILIDKPWAPGPLTIVKRDVFDMVGGYDEKASYAEDHDLSMMIFERGIPFQVFREVLYIYSLRRFRKEGTPKMLERNIKSFLKVVVSGRGVKHVSDYTGGGSIYEKQATKKRTNSQFPKKIVLAARKFIKEFIAQ